MAASSSTSGSSTVDPAPDPADAGILTRGNLFRGSVWKKPPGKRCSAQVCGPTRDTREAARDDREKLLAAKDLPSARGIAATLQAEASAAAQGTQRPAPGVVHSGDGWRARILRAPKLKFGARKVRQVFTPKRRTAADAAKDAAAVQKQKTLRGALATAAQQRRKDKDTGIDEFEPGVFRATFQPRHASGQHKFVGPRQTSRAAAAQDRNVLQAKHGTRLRKVEPGATKKQGRRTTPSRPAAPVAPKRLPKAQPKKMPKIRKNPVLQKRPPKPPGKKK